MVLAAFQPLHSEILSTRKAFDAWVVEQKQLLEAQLQEAKQQCLANDQRARGHLQQQAVLTRQLEEQRHLASMSHADELGKAESAVQTALHEKQALESHLQQLMNELVTVSAASKRMERCLGIDAVKQNLILRMLSLEVVHTTDGNMGWIFTNVSPQFPQREFRVVVGLDATADGGRFVVRSAVPAIPFTAEDYTLLQGAQSDLRHLQLFLIRTRAKFAAAVAMGL
eukprot:TRINITY_DN15809_c0_g1_i1.p1 TRINITY_DN15809_c0_g1~~TRINITY_DN15809_c0_g1_i1.p1  ORF type:complete len:226 (+),score=38.30 TRINITY_DN15809_c0_g1_i1:3-680(+)